jgi:hypothetical protein
VGFAVMVGLWIFFMVVCGGYGGLRWWVCTLQWVSNFFLFFFLILQVIVVFLVIIHGCRKI